MLRYAPSREFIDGEITAYIINQHLNEAAFEEAVTLATRNGNQSQWPLRKYKLLRNLLILDSEKENPISLTSLSDWAKLNGSTITLACGSIWNHLEPASVLHLADCNMPFDQNTNINNSVISIDDTPPPPATTIYTISLTLPTPSSTDHTHQTETVHS